MTYKRRVGPRNYSRKTVGKQPLPILGKGARYEFITEEEPSRVPDSPSSPSRPTTTASPLEPLATRPVRARVQKMSAGTLPMPSLRAGSLSYQYNPRSVPYGSFAARHGPIDRIAPAVEVNEMKPIVARVPPGGFWNQLLGAAAEQEKLEGALGKGTTHSPSGSRLPEPPLHANGQKRMSSYGTTPVMPGRSHHYQGHPYCPLPLVQANSPTQPQISYFAGNYRAFPFPPPSTDRKISSPSDASPPMLMTPLRRIQDDKTQAREPREINCGSTSSSRISIASIGGTYVVQKERSPSVMVTRDTYGEMHSPADIEIDIRRSVTTIVPPFQLSLGSMNDGTMRGEDGIVITGDNRSARTPSFAGTEHGGGISVKVEDCDEPHCWT